MLNDSKTGFMGRKKAPYISKSTYLMGLQCQKLIWFRYNAKDQIPAPDEATQAIFDQGTEVGELTRQLFPDGIVVAPGIINPDEVVAETKNAVQARRPLYEAAFVFHGGYARTDILVPVAGDAWDLIEVKSTTKLKEEVHLPDIAFQAFVLAGAGIQIRKCFLPHINTNLPTVASATPRPTATSRLVGPSAQASTIFDRRARDWGLFGRRAQRSSVSRSSSVSTSGFFGRPSLGMCTSMVTCENAPSNPKIPDQAIFLVNSRLRTLGLMETFGCNGVRCRAGSRDNRPAPDRGHSRAGSLDEAMDVGTRPRHDGRGCEGSDLGVARHRGGTGSSTPSIQTFQAHTDAEGSGRISEGGAYGKWTWRAI